MEGTITETQTSEVVVIALMEPLAPKNFDQDLF